MSQGPIAAVVVQLSLRYVKASLVYLLAGGTLLFTTLTHVLTIDMTAFYFMELYGFVAMMIFGLSYLFIPSFSHAFLHSLKLAKLQFWLMNLSVIALSVSFSGRLPYTASANFVVVGSVVILLLALYMHAYNLWLTMRAWKGSPGEALAKQAAGRQ
jgi:cbb3-type cytochrome oxidase subunit 1